MTNEDKAREISSQYDPIGIAEDAALEMAEWKDQLLRDIREKKIEKFNTYYDGKLNHNVQERCLGVIFAIDDFFGEDSRDKLHCAFTTMD